MEERIERMEEKLAWLERHLLELDGVVRQVVDQLSSLRLELGEIREKQSAMQEEPSSYEVPPHY